MVSTYERYGGARAIPGRCSWVRDSQRVRCLQRPMVRSPYELRVAEAWEAGCSAQARLGGGVGLDRIALLVCHARY